MDEARVRMNKFTPAQIRVIRDLAEFYWDNYIKEFHVPATTKDEAREKYIQDIVKGMIDPEVWG